MNIPNQDIKNIQLRNQWNEALDATQKILNILTPVKQAASYNDAGIIDRYFTHVRIAKQYALQQAVDFLSFGPNAYQDPMEYMQHLHCVLGELKSDPESLMEYLVIARKKLSKAVYVLRVNR